MRAPKTARKTAFVPRIIFKAAAAVAVVPLCAACGGTVIDPLTNDGGPDVILPSVALIMSDASDVEIFGVAVECFTDGGSPPCYPTDAGIDVQFTVAASCFDGGGYCPDAGVADATFGDVFLGVAADAFVPDASKKS
jgi:hypothetical protein